MPDSKPTPTAFICHASDDKARFVEPFARELFKAGVQAWYDGWEIELGDGLLGKISDGIGSAGFFVFVATPASLRKPWVKAELEGGFAKRLRGETRLITLVLDGCADQLPELLKGIRYREVANPTEVGSLVQDLLPTFFGDSGRPPLGPAPGLASLPSPPAGLDLTAVDWGIFVSLCATTLDDVGGFLQGDVLRQVMASSELTERLFCDALEALQEQGFVDLSLAMGPGTIGRGISHARITTFGFEAYLEAAFPDYSQIKRRVMVEVVNRERCNSVELLASVSAPPRIVIHVAEWIEQANLAQVSFSLGPGRPFFIARPSVRLRRMVDE